MDDSLPEALGHLRQAVQAVQKELETGYGTISKGTLLRRRAAVLKALDGEPEILAEVRRRLDYWNRAVAPGGDLSGVLPSNIERPDEWQGPWPPGLRSAKEWQDILDSLHECRRLGDCNLRSQFLRIIKRAGLKPWPRLDEKWSDRIQAALDEADRLSVEGLAWLFDPDLEDDLTNPHLIPEVMGRLSEAVEVLTALEAERLAAAETQQSSNTPTSENGPPKPLKRPCENAIKAWRLRDLQGKIQKEIGEELGTKQGQVSRWLKQVRDYLNAGNVLPDLGAITKSKPIDPANIEMGARMDGRTPRQRQQRSED